MGTEVGTAVGTEVGTGWGLRWGLFGGENTGQIDVVNPSDLTTGFVCPSPHQPPMETAIA